MAAKRRKKISLFSRSMSMMKITRRWRKSMNRQILLGSWKLLKKPLRREMSTNLKN
jgi:hypothetical protein